MDETNDIEIDERETDPNASYRKFEGAFRAGWTEYKNGERFKHDSLKRLTWNNLGWRLARLFKDAPPEMIDSLYDWCVRQQAWAQRQEKERRRGQQQ